MAFLMPRVDNELKFIFMYLLLVQNVPTLTKKCAKSIFVKKTCLLKFLIVP
jgi:hypothetical protein